MTIVTPVSISGYVDEYVGGKTRYSPELLATAAAAAVHSVGELSTNLLLNAIDQAPTARYNAVDTLDNDNWPAWTYGNTLTAQGSPINPICRVGSPGDDPDVDDAVRYGNYDHTGLGGYISHWHQEDGSTVQLGTEDCVIHFIFFYDSRWAGPPAASPKTQMLFSNYDTVAARGISVSVVEDTTVSWNFVGAGGTGTVSYALADGYHDVMVFLRRAENGARFLFVVDNETAHDSTGYVNIGDCTSTRPFCMAAQPQSGLYSNIEVLFFAFYKRASWLAAGDTQYNACITLAQDRYAVGPISSTETQTANLGALDKLGLADAGLIGTNLDSMVTLIGSDAGATKWWPLQGTAPFRIFGQGTAPSLGVSTPWGTGVQFNGEGGSAKTSQGYACMRDRAFGDIDTEDLVVEWIEKIINPSDTDLHFEWAKRELSGYYGYFAYRPVTWVAPIPQNMCAAINHGGAGGGYDLECYASPPFAPGVGESGLTDTRYNYYLYIMDRDRWPNGSPIGSGLFLNGSRGTAEVKTPWAATASTLAPFCVGQARNRQCTANSVVVAIRAWKGASLIPADDAAIDALVQARFDAVHDGLTFGVGSISTTATINDLAGTLVADYTGEDGGAGGWASNGGAGPTLTLTGSGTDPTYQAWVPGTTAQDKAVKLNAGKYFSHAGSTVDITTEDMLWVCVFQYQTPVSYNALAHKADGAALTGYHITTGANHFYSFYGWGGAYIQHDITVNSWAPGSWHFAAGYLDHDDASHGSYLWLDGVRYGPLNKGNGSSLTTTAPFDMGYGAWIGASSSDAIALWRLWKRSSWFAGGTTGRDQIETFVAQCYAALRPQ